TYHPAPIIRAALDRAVERLAGEGLIIRDEELPGLSEGIGVYHALSSVEAASNLARFDGMRYGRRPSPTRADGIDRADGADQAGAADRSGEDASFLESVSLARSQGFGAEVRRRILLGTWLSSRSDSAGRLDGARRLRARISADFEALFERVDLLVTPSTGARPFRLGAHTGDPVSLYEHDAWTIPASLAGLPAVSIPFAPADVLSDGPGTEPPDWIPGIQIIGPRHSDRFVAEFAASLQDRPG
ncbi:MAG: hypothetical protein HKN17_11335, partial [Rhodothermales bacterium]|nr:hypothetical protein [Rhodothermales bacterium]